MKIKDLFELLAPYDKNSEINFYDQIADAWRVISSIEDKVDTDSGKRTKSVDINLIEE